MQRERERFQQHLLECAFLAHAGTEVIFFALSHGVQVPVRYAQAPSSFPYLRHSAHSSPKLLRRFRTIAELHLTPQHSRNRISTVSGISIDKLLKFEYVRISLHSCTRVHVFKLTLQVCTIRRQQQLPVRARTQRLRDCYRRLRPKIQQVARTHGFYEVGTCADRLSG